MKLLSRLSTAAQTRIDLAAITALLVMLGIRADAALAAVTAPLIAAVLYVLVLIYSAPDEGADPAALKATSQWVVAWVLIFICTGVLMETARSVRHDRAQTTAPVVERRR